MSANLQRFRQIEKLNKEKRDLAEKQLALLESQRLAALQSRSSYSPLSSPMVGVCQQPVRTCVAQGIIECCQE